MNTYDFAGRADAALAASIDNTTLRPPRARRKRAFRAAKNMKAQIAATRTSSRIAGKPVFGASVQVGEAERVLAYWRLLNAGARSDERRHDAAPDRNSRRAA